MRVGVDRTTHNGSATAQSIAPGLTRSHVPDLGGVLAPADSSRDELTGELVVGAPSTTSHSEPGFSDNSGFQPRLFTPGPDPSDCRGEIYRNFYCAKCGHVRPVRISCGDRTCPTCRRIAYKRLLARYCPDVELVDLSTLALVTLTRRIYDRVDLRARTAETRRAFSKLLRLKEVRAVIAGGLYGLECKLRIRRIGIRRERLPDGTWNIHLHALVESRAPVARWLDAKGELNADLRGPGGARLRPQDLGAMWARFTGDSYIVQVKPITDAHGAVKEVVKYLAKGTGLPTAGPWRAEYNRAFKGARLVQSFGSWHARSKDYGFDALEREPRPFRCPTCGGTEWISEYELRRLEWRAAHAA